MLMLGLTLAQGAVRDASGQTLLIKDTSRVIAVGSSVTEIIYALGAEKRLVGVDSSSNFPAAAQKLPQVGYRRSLGAEGVLSLGPSLIIAVDDTGPPAVLVQLRGSGVPLLLVDDTPSLEGVKANIRLIGKALALDERAEALVRRIEVGALQARALYSQIHQRPRVVFVYSSGSGNLTLSGTGTAADSMIKLAGGVNAVTGYSGYKAITAEALVLAQPDYIVMLDRGLQAVGGIEGFLKTPGVAATPAGRNRRILSFEGNYLLGFGPRAGQAILELTLALHPELRVAQRP
ncbi:MAG: hemin ABC transporter substrate-binding protein [Meiothermus sp.]|nr:hemin ABC transporter substrate-binding protein [Meiothermus sp.]